MSDDTKRRELFAAFRALSAGAPRVVINGIEYGPDAMPMILDWIEDMTARQFPHT